ncbi:MAG: hypothetical protein MRY83_16225, partial [Flavobacteriales bacterium]|nr:hypothetical protein [Flavobacteriales bacterium]
MKNSILSLLLILSFSIFAQRSSNNIEFNGNSYSNWKSSAQILSGLQSHNDYNVRLSENQIGIQSKVLVNIKATDFLIVFNLIQSGETAAQTDELINVRINNFLNALESLEIPKENIYVDMISMIPIFESDLAKKLFSNTKNEVPTAFEMQKNIHIKFKDIRLVDKMVSLAAQSEI